MRGPWIYLLSQALFMLSKNWQKINDIKCDHCWLQKKRLLENRLKIHIDIKKLFSIYVRFYCYCCNGNVIFLYLLHVVIYLFLAILKKTRIRFCCFCTPYTRTIGMKNKYINNDDAEWCYREYFEHIKSVDRPSINCFDEKWALNVFCLKMITPF